MSRVFFADKNFSFSKEKMIVIQRSIRFSVFSFFFPSFFPLNIGRKTLTIIPTRFQHSDRWKGKKFELFDEGTTYYEKGPIFDRRDNNSS